MSPEVRLFIVVDPRDDYDARNSLAGRGSC